ncbi:MAG: hypothetical protein R3C05_04895 [Pirellulaceae bacterium]
MLCKLCERAFLCGDDPVTGQSFEHRGWIRERLQFLASRIGLTARPLRIPSESYSHRFTQQAGLAAGSDAKDAGRYGFWRTVSYSGFTHLSPQRFNAQRVRDFWIRVVDLIVGFGYPTC